jgi:hypothetical protein
MVNKLTPAIAMLALVFWAIHLASVRAAADDTTMPSVDISKIHYVVEYEPPTVYTLIGNVQITVFAEASQAELVAILNKEIRKQIHKDDPTSDVMTTAWLHKERTDPSSDEVTGDSDGFPYYILATKQIMPVSEAKKTGKMEH